MPNLKNQEIIKEIDEQLKSAKSLILADYSGISVNEQTELRQKIKASGGNFGVLKNRLIKLALTNRLEKLPETLENALNGPTAIVFGQDDAITPTKTLVDFAKDHDTLKLKAGMLLKTDESSSDQVLNIEDLKNLASLPSKPELIGMLLSRLNAPIYGLANVLQGNLRNLVYALNEIKNKKSESN